MIIGKSLTALGGGGLKPEIRVTALAGSLLNLHYKDSSIILKSYQLGAEETQHTFVVDVSETSYVVEDVTNGKSAEVLVDAVAVFDVQIMYGILLSSFVEGDIVKLNENGSLVEFYVAKHNYESALNGTGRTLLVRKNIYDSRAWNSERKSTYANSAIDTWLNNTYKNLFDSDTQSSIGTTKFYYTVGYANATITTLERSVFLISVTESGLTSEYANVEGSALPIGSTLRIGYLNGSAYCQWTRSPRYDSDAEICVLMPTGVISRAMPTVNGGEGSRPAFTLPSTALFDENTFVFKGVA